MEQSGGAKGPLIVGVKHSGARSAKELVSLLERNGLTEGTVVAIEGFSRHEKADPKGELATAVAQINELETELAELDAKYGGRETERMVGKIIFGNELESRQWSAALYSFLIKKKARVVGWDIFKKKLERFSLWEKPFKKNYKEFMVAMPIRNRVAARSIMATRPGIVICGSEHAREIGRRIPGSRVVMLATTSGSARKYETVYRIRALFRKLRRGTARAKKTFWRGKQGR